MADFAYNEYIYSLSMQIYNKTQVNEIALALKNDKAAVLPTDTVWGIVSLTENKIFKIKKRSLEKKVCKFIDSIDSIGLPPFLADIVRPYMNNGGLSIIWKGVGYRVPKCAYLIDLLKLTGPLYQSSANISGKPPIVMSQQAFVEFKDMLHALIIVDNSPWEQSTNQSSTIVDLDKCTVVRPGPVNGQEIIDKINKAKGAK